MEDISREKLKPAIELLAANHSDYESEIQDLHGWLLNSQAQERHRMNAYRVSQSTAIPVDRLIRILLWGTQKSVFQLHWQQHCPHCNMITAEYDSLAASSGESYCKMCDTEYSVDFKERVEVTFSLHPSIEELEIPPYCLPPRSLKPVAQLSMARGEVEDAEFQVSPGVYRYYCPITMSMGKMHVEDKEGESELEIHQLADSTFNPPEIHISAGQVHLKAVNETVPISGLIIHEDKLAHPIPFQDLELHLNGLEIIHYPEFREIFGDDALSDREKMTISSVTILFTDITGSTRMYERLGDVQAYNIVRDHFQILIEAIQNRGGTIIKTIGDAVMASFIESETAFRSIFEAMDEFENYNSQKDDDHRVNLKIGIHSGPAILVNLNDRLDYFGSTVNKAARIQSLARSHQIAFSEEILGFPGIKKLLVSRGMRNLLRRQASLKGLSGSHPIYFLSLENAPA